MLRAVRVTARQIVPAVRTVVRGARARARPFRDLESRSILRAAAHPPRVAESDMRMCKRTAVRPGCSLFTPRGARSRDRCGWRAGTSEAAIETIDRTIVIAAYVSGSWRDDDHPASPEQVAQHQRPDKTERGRPRVGGAPVSEPSGRWRWAVPERHPHANLLRSLRDCIRNRGMESDRRQHEGDRGTDAEHGSPDAPPPSSLGQYRFAAAAGIRIWGWPGSASSSEVGGASPSRMRGPASPVVTCPRAERRGVAPSPGARQSGGR